VQKAQPEKQEIEISASSTPTAIKETAGPSNASRIATVPNMALMLRRSLSSIVRPMSSAVQRAVSVRSFHASITARTTYEEWVQSSSPSYHQTIQKKWYPRAANGTVSSNVQNESMRVHWNFLRIDLMYDIYVRMMSSLSGKRVLLYIGRASILTIEQRRKMISDCSP
jgi:hypothetical protein